MTVIRQPNPIATGKWADPTALLDVALRELADLGDEVGLPELREVADRLAEIGYASKYHRDQLLVQLAAAVDLLGGELLVDSAALDRIYRRHLAANPVEGDPEATLVTLGPATTEGRA